MRTELPVTEAVSAPALLTHAGWRGTLAAVRCLGAPGDSAALLDWLRELGAREPGCVLYPSCDDLAWLFSLHRAELGRWFRLYSPPIEALEGLLDKRRLHALAQEAGLSTLPTWYPESEQEALALLPQLPFPVLLKPRTQVLSLTHGKGVRADRPEELAFAWRRARERTRHAPELLARLPEAVQPMVQAYCAEGADSIYTVSGFAGRGEGQFAARASRKLLQRPRGLGVGICFGSAPLPAALEEALATLCRRAGYFGAFDAEFLEVDGRPKLIDFNPRYYNQMAFEVARGLPVPWLVQLGACGDEEGLARAVAQARAVRPHPDATFCDRFVTGTDLLWQVLLRTIPPAEERRLWRWHRAHRAHEVDPFEEAGDPGPQLAEIACEVAAALRHPRAFLRHAALGRR